MRPPPCCSAGRNYSPPDVRTRSRRNRCNVSARLHDVQPSGLKGFPLCLPDSHQGLLKKPYLSFWEPAKVSFLFASCLLCLRLSPPILSRPKLSLNMCFSHCFFLLKFAEHDKVFKLATGLLGKKQNRCCHSKSYCHSKAQEGKAFLRFSSFLSPAQLAGKGPGVEGRGPKRLQTNQKGPQLSGLVQTLLALKVLFFFTRGSQYIRKQLCLP